MKVLVFAGSPRPEKSVSLEAARRMLGEFAEMSGEEPETEIITEKSAEIDSCRGCMSCFHSGICPLEKHDGMAEIKKKMLEADIIVFATPIYAANVSVFMNMLFQRLSGWLHMMPLMGRKAVLVTSSCGNGIGIVNNYMRNVVWGLGIRIASVLNVIAREKADLDSGHNADITEKSARLLSVCVSEDTVPELFNSGLEKYFSSLKEQMARSGEENGYEYEYWEKTGLFDCGSFEEAEALICENKMIGILEV